MLSPFSWLKERAKMVWTWSKTKVAPKIQEVRGRLAQKTAGYLSNTRSYIVLTIGFIALVLFVRRMRMSATEAVGDLHLGKIALYGGIGLAFVLLLWLIWSKRASVTSALRSAGSTSGTADVQKTVLAVFTALVAFFLFNLAFWAMLKTPHGNWGAEYFSAWLWSPAFIALGVATMVMAFSFGKADKRFQFVSIPAGVMIAVTVVMAMYPGIRGPVRPKAPTGAEEVAANYVLPAKLPDAPWRIYTGPVKDSVIAAFPGDTTMWDIAGSESEFRQFDTTGKPLPNSKGSSAVGVFQILEGDHGRRCGTDSLDIYTISGNIACAKILRARNGYRDWASSAWKWRDRYSTEPEHWEFDRTPEQLIAGNSGGTEVVIVDVPSDGSWSVPFRTYGRRAGLKLDRPVDLFVQDETGQVIVVRKGEKIPWPRPPKVVTLRTEGEPAKATFTRMNE